MAADVACRLRPDFPVQCGMEAPFWLPLRWNLAAPRQEQPPTPAASVGPRGSPCAIWFFRSNSVLFQSNGAVSRPIRARELIETDRYPFRHKMTRDSDTGRRSAVKLAKPGGLRCPLPCSHWPFSTALRGMSTPGALGPADPWPARSPCRLCLGTIRDVAPRHRLTRSPGTATRSAYRRLAPV
jgi:hypothetical protein